MMTRRAFSAAALVLGMMAVSATASAQTTVYYLHNEASLINAAKQLKKTGPDVAQVALQTANLKGLSGNYQVRIAYFEAQTNAPLLAGTLPAGSLISFSLRMKNSRVITTTAHIYPYALLRLNTSTGPVLCGRGQGFQETPALTATLATYTFTCLTQSTITTVGSERP